MSAEEQQQVPASEDLYELHFFEVSDMRSDEALKPKFVESIVMGRNFDINNKQFQQSLYLNENLDVMGPLHHADRYNFGFVRSYAKTSPPIMPALQSLASVAYPCIMHCSP